MTLLALIIGLIAGAVFGYIIALPSGHVSRFHVFHKWKPWVVIGEGSSTTMKRSCVVCNYTVRRVKVEQIR